MANFGTIEYYEESGLRCGAFLSPRTIMLCHTAEILYVRSGTAEIYAYRKSHELIAGQAMFIDEDEPHSVTADGEIAVLGFARGELPFLTDTLASPVLTHRYDVEGAYARIRNELLLRERFYKEAALREMCALMTDIFRHETTAKRTAPPAVSRLLKEISDREGNLPFIRAAEIMNMNPAYFSRYFKAVGGVTYSSYLNRVRISKAVRMLDEGTPHISEVAKACGFEMRNFNRTFKEITGYVPKRLPEDFTIYDNNITPQKARCDGDKPLKIKVIYTGGTIGSSVKGGVIQTDSEVRGRLVERYRETDNTVSFEEFSPVEMLSENVLAHDLAKIVKSVAEGVKSGYDGIIVTHGTDTLTFTAALLSEVCPARIPIVVLGALYPLTDERTDGYGNFGAAVEFIREGLAGVFVSCRSESGEQEIHVGSRATGNPLSGRVESIGGRYGSVRNGIFFRNPRCEYLPATPKTATAPLKLCTDILTLSPTPLTDYSLIEIGDGIKAAVVRPYHSGTVCTVGDGTNFLAFADRCAAKGVKVVLAPIQSGAVYESVSGKLSDVTTADCTFESAIVKIMLELGRNKK